MADNPEKIRVLSRAIESGNLIWNSWALSSGGEVISFNGVEFRLRMPAERLNEIDSLREQYAQTIGSSVSIGIGARLSEADKALQVAQKQGGDQIRLYDPSVEQDLEESKENQGLRKDEPEMNSPAAGGGIAPPAEGSGDGPQVEPSPQQGAPAPQEAPDFHAQFGQLAQSQEASDQQEQQEAQPSPGDDIRSNVVEILKVFKQKAPELEALQQQDPKLYQSLVAMVQTMTGMAQQLLQSQSIQKSEPFQKLIKKDLMPGGKGDNAPDTDFDAKQLAAGMKIEMEEHGLDEARAKEVAKDHLSEDPNYYTVRKGWPKDDAENKANSDTHEVLMDILHGEGRDVSEEVPKELSRKFDNLLHSPVLAARSSSSNFAPPSPQPSLTRFPNTPFNIAGDQNADHEFWDNTSWETGLYTPSWTRQKSLNALRQRALGKSELAKMAIRDIPKGKEVTDIISKEDIPRPEAVVLHNGQHAKWGRYKVFDYSHLLPPEHQNRFGLFVRERGDLQVPKNYQPVKNKYGNPTMTDFHTILEAKLKEKRISGKDSAGSSFYRSTIGLAEASKLHDSPEELKIDYVDLDKTHQGKGLGQALYEAVIAHAHHYHGVKYVKGDVHSSFANKAHLRLAAKHGMEYKPDAITGYGQRIIAGEETPRPFDGAYRGYKYAIKNELQKMAIKDLRPGTFEGSHEINRGEAEIYDYSHLLPKTSPGKLFVVDRKTSHGPSYHKEQQLDVHYARGSSWNAELLANSLMHRPDVFVPKGSGRGVVESKVSRYSPGEATALAIEYSRLDPNLRGQGIGQAMYEAAMAHSHHRHGARIVRGDLHSTMANRVHTKLAAKHNMKYVAQERWNPKNSPGSVGANDNRFGPYEYKMVPDEPVKDVGAPGDYEAHWKLAAKDGYGK